MIEKERQKLKRQNRKNLGLCKGCSQKARPGKRTCQACADNAKSYMASRKERLKKEGRCLICAKHTNSKLKHCRSCLDKMRMKNYNLSQKDIDQINKIDHCEICRVKFKNSKNRHIDHDHETGCVRGVLCSNCNRVLGLVKDSPLTCYMAGKYLERHKRLSEVS